MEDILRVIQNNDLDTLRVLLVNNSQSDLDQALQLTAKCGHLLVVKHLVEQGADIHADDDLALQWAVMHERLSIVKYLIKQGANIHADNDRMLQQAAIHGYSPVAIYLQSLI